MPTSNRFGVLEQSQRCRCAPRCAGSCEATLCACLCPCRGDFSARGAALWAVDPPLRALSRRCATRASARPARRCPTSTRSRSTRRSSSSPWPMSICAASSRCRRAFRRSASTRTGARCSRRSARSIDSVNVSIPDHMHCAVALEAMKLGKAVYVQKPLCNTLRETRLLTEEARRRGPDDADGHPGVVEHARSATAKRSCAAGSSARFARCTRSRTRAGATTSRCRRLDDPVPRRRSTGTAGWA